MTTDPLELARVRRLAAHRRRVERAYLAALTDAWGAGHSFAEIARAAGVTRQAVRQQLTRPPADPRP